MFLQNPRPARLSSAMGGGGYPPKFHETSVSGRFPAASQTRVDRIIPSKYPQTLESSSGEETPTVPMLADQKTRRRINPECSRDIPRAPQRSVAAACGVSASEPPASLHESSRFPSAIQALLPEQPLGWRAWYASMRITSRDL